MLRMHGLKRFAVCAAMAGLAALVAPIVAQDAPAPAVKSNAAAQALGMLPKDSVVAVAVNFDAMKDKQSLMSLLPQAELEKVAAEELAKPGNEVQASPDAAFRIALMPGMLSKVHALAFSMVPEKSTTTGTAPASMGLENPTEYTVLLGDFKTAEVGPQLKSLGIKPAAPELGLPKTVALLPTADGKEYFLSLPTDGVILISQESGWAKEGGQQLAQAKTGLTSQGSAFGDTWKGVAASATPDIMVYVDSAIMKQAASENPMQAAMFSPLLTSRGLMLSLMPGTQPTLELVASYADPQAAQLGTEFFRNGVMMLKGMIPQFMGQQAQASPEAQAQIAEQMKFLDSLQISTAGNQAKVVWAMPEEYKATFQQNITEGLKNVGEGGVVNPLGGALGTGL